ncbi:hypothetical protein FTO74_15050 [Granulicella sp. WH15]|uniref:hypothetical protein n=1 Tax=Granulicella sp. WH15 TaxID=2602070 RepID=UPI00136720F9|nr:hypothetical protein [Granulicella sp. WH15]QHN04532.1 hypothetical protein FTO74_15050 [Granulicella sp. WH15]
MTSSLLSATLLLTLQAIPPAATPATPDQSEIHIDGRCRILSQDRTAAAQPYSRPHYRWDSGICHFESENASSHWEENIENGVVKRTYVTIREHEYLLHNPAPTPVTFVVDQAVPRGWKIDSDPQPDEFTNSVATFRVQAQPGQTVRLHVGERR